MSDDAQEPSPVLDLLADTGGRRGREFTAFWQDLVDADPRLAALRDNDEWREGIEGRLLAWRGAADAPRLIGEWSRPQVVGLAERVRRLRGEIEDLSAEAWALAHAAEGGVLDQSIYRLWAEASLLADALGPLLNAANALETAPRKAGGRGEYTANLRPRPDDEFGEAAAAIFRQAGLSLGGNASRDTAFAHFVAIAGRFATGGPIPGMALLLARLRR